METLKYEQALAELETIAEQLENGQCDIDDLINKLNKAKELIALCTEKLRRADHDIQQTLSSTPDV